MHLSENYVEMKLLKMRKSLSMELFLFAYQVVWFGQKGDGPRDQHLLSSIALQSDSSIV